MGKVNHYFLIGESRCVHCDGLQKTGDPVATKRGGSGLRNLYCEECALALYIVEKRLKK